MDGGRRQEEGSGRATESGVVGVAKRQRGKESTEEGLRAGRAGLGFAGLDACMVQGAGCRCRVQLVGIAEKGVRPTTPSREEARR